MIKVHHIRELLPITVVDNNQSATWFEPSILGSIPTLQTILNQIFEDWISAADAQKALMDVDSEEDRTLRFAQSVEELTPRYIQCLFSYITFFFMLEGGYQQLYADLNKLNGELKLNLKHDKPPKRDDLINRLWLIRNKSVAHWAEARTGDLDGAAGRSWGLFCMKGDDGNYDVEKLQFGAMALSRHDENTGEVQRSQDRETKPIGEIHATCASYLSKFDQVCLCYLEDIKAQLPISLNGRDYSFEKPGETAA